MQPLSLAKSEITPMLTTKSYENRNYLPAPQQCSSTRSATAGHPQDFKTIHVIIKIAQKLKHINTHLYFVDFSPLTSLCCLISQIREKILSCTDGTRQSLGLLRRAGEEMC